ncbi:pyruvate kinase [Schleiferilactobacillus shenzhenensis]|uniref:Pyruvate kinase n=1 Tax=Schleiferilactobacillus shenzhenensis LY-73 TaxID=1231336 RepID=U4TQD9_9LACO|nr:pyruvate kinase [Schleiferilactobacillus shenzhenensis]ERL63737.1 hypothetical protein L248_2234 [Schleiferilactobacillus shenzhenensis LY-73]
MNTKIVLPVQLPMTNESNLSEALHAGVTVLSINPFQSNQSALNTFYEIVTRIGKEAGIVPGILFDIPVGAELNAINLMSEVSKKEILTRVETGFEHGVSILALPISGSPILTDIRNSAVSHPNVLILAKIAAKTDMTKIGVTPYDDYDGLFLDRDHLAKSMPIEDMPGVEQTLISQFVTFGKPVVTSGQMLSSLMLSAAPVSGDVTDVAFAVMSGTDALFLSDAAARSGSLQAVNLLKRIASRAEVAHTSTFLQDRINDFSITDATAAEAISMARQKRVKAIVTITSAGYTARQISRYKPKVPVIAVTDNTTVAGALQISWGVTPLMVARGSSRETFIESAIGFLKTSIHMRPGDVVVIVSGIPFGKAKHVNNLIVQEYQE